MLWEKYSVMRRNNERCHQFIADSLRPHLYGKSSYLIRNALALNSANSCRTKCCGFYFILTACDREAHSEFHLNWAGILSLSFLTPNPRP